MSFGSCLIYKVYCRKTRFQTLCWFSTSRLGYWKSSYHMCTEFTNNAIVFSHPEVHEKMQIQHFIGVRACARVQHVPSHIFGTGARKGGIKYYCLFHCFRGTSNLNGLPDGCKLPHMFRLRVRSKKRKLHKQINYLAKALKDTSLFVSFAWLRSAQRLFLLFFGEANWAVLEFKMEYSNVDAAHRTTAQPANSALSKGYKLRVALSFRKYLRW